MTVNTFCRACGAKLEHDALFCTDCGATLVKPPAPAEGPKILTALPHPQKDVPTQDTPHHSTHPLDHEWINKAGNRLKVSLIKTGSQAEQLGIKVGDFIISYNKVPVCSNLELSNAVLVAKKTGFALAEIVVARVGQHLNFEATLEPLGLNCEEISVESATSVNKSIYEYQTEYSVSRIVSFIVSFVGWVVVLVGSIVVFSAVTSDAKTIGGALSMVAILPGVGAVIAGFVLILWAQILRAAVDNADHTREIMKLLYRKMN
jgi:hypothetical protein